MRLIGYVRVSSSGQLDAYGPDVQEQAIRTWAKANGHKVVQVLVDDITGKADALERPKLLEALRMLRRPPEAEGLVVMNLTRLARQLTIQEAILALIWREGGKVFASDQGEVLQDDPDDPMRTAMRQVQGVFAQLDRATLTKRLRDGRKMKAAEGKHAVGQYAFGTHGVGRGRERDAAPREDEQAAVARIVELRAAGESYRSICAALDAEGFKPRRAATWSSMSVRNIALRAGCA
jgi:DNA invertase Pin-like site-specific DNA recombinase